MCVETTYQPVVRLFKPGSYCTQLHLLRMRHAYILNLRMSAVERADCQSSLFFSPSLLPPFPLPLLPPSFLPSPFSSPPLAMCIELQSDLSKPSRILFVEEVTELVKENLPDLWNLGCLYLSKSLYAVSV